ncbi:Negative regulator of mitotic exit [Elasticomyces elasticus]|nr:Negative regulator of mitotic exit [Elasticomyces elasticus]
MSFLFGKTKKPHPSSSHTPSSALPIATRDIRSSDGPSSQTQPSQFGNFNGSSKPGSPTPGAMSVNASLSSLAGANGGILAGGERSSSAPPQEDGSGNVQGARQQFLRNQNQQGSSSGLSNGMSVDRNGTASPALGGGNMNMMAEQKSLSFRDASQSRGLLPQQQQAPNGSLRSSPSSSTALSTLNAQNPITTNQNPLQNLTNPSHSNHNSSSSDSSPYPWSQRRLTFTVSHTNPFPRYGAAVNATSSKDGSIYLMGGLINGSTVKGDLWMVEAGVPQANGSIGNAASIGGTGGMGGMGGAGGKGEMVCYPVATTSEGPGPRVGHASLLVGNAFIVFGGDTKMDEGDLLDDTLYLLNTSTKQWSRALPAGPRPPGRYGHTLNILGSKIYIFGGQVEGYFFNDLVAFDLNALQAATNRWEILITNTIDGGPPHGQIPPARTNHTVISYNDKLYLFGGTDGVTWYNDVWSYSPHTNSWTQLDCIGYIPSPREGHAAALVGDVMYIFGGRTEGGEDLGDLAAFRIGSRRWYTFQNMGPSPSPRSGHSMTTVGKSIVVLAGEPSSAPRDAVELGMGYYLDTAKIRYPPDSASQTPVGDRIQGTRRPSGDQSGMGSKVGGLAQNFGGAVRSPSSAAQMQFPTQTSPAELADRPRMGSGDSYGSKIKDGMANSRLPRMASNGAVLAPSPAPSGPVPMAPTGQVGKGVNGGANANVRQPTRPLERAMSPGVEGAERARGFENQNFNSGFMSSSGGGGGGNGSIMGGRDSPAIRNTQVEARQPLSPGFSSAGFGEQRAPLSPGLSQTGGFGGFPPETPYFDAEEDPMVQQQQHQQQQQKRAKPETYQPSQEASNGESLSRTPSRNAQQNNPNLLGARSGVGRSESVRTENMDRVVDSDTPRQSVQSSVIPEEELPKVQRQITPTEKSEEPQDSGIGSSPAAVNGGGDGRVVEELRRELEGVRQKNAWFASELALARKSGFAGRSGESPVLDERGEGLREEDKPLVEALLKMRAELAKVQGSIEEQGRLAAERIAQVERQRDTAVSEAVFARARLAGHDSGGGEQERELQKRLAGVLAREAEMQRKTETLVREMESERQARQVGEETAEAAQRRVTELEGLRQSLTSELEGLRDELHETQTGARELEATHAEVSGQHRLLGVDRNELSEQLERVRGEHQEHVGVLASLREAVQASTQKAEVLERKVEEERSGRDEVEGRLRQLKSEHEERSGELESTTRRLRDAEELAERHAHEARTHREAVLAGLGNISTRSVDPSSGANDERLSVLQQRVEEANAMVRQNQAAADAASQKLRSAEERIAGLEAYQEQASREGLAIRKQLQVAMREKQSVESEKTELEQKLQSMMLDTNALAVQHSSLKDILHERGINAAEVRRSRALDSPSSALSNRFSTPDLHRVKDLEQQLEASLKSHDEMKAQFEEVSERDEKMKREYEEKLTALDNDHQAAVKYLRGTEKMLSKMKQELQRVKNENGELRRRVEKAKEDEGVGAKGVSADAEAEWEKERNTLRDEVEKAQMELKRNVSNMETRITEMQQQMAHSESELDTARSAHATSTRDLTSLQANHSLARGDLERLQQENILLEERARDAENKVQLLLDQVEHSVDNYRRQSRRVSLAPGSAGLMVNGTGGHHQRNLSGASGISQSTVGTMGMGHTRNLSDTAESTYSVDAPSTTGEGGHGEDGRNSMALDALAGELDALRSHWETTNKSYRLSDKFEFERKGSNPAVTPEQGGASGGEFGGLASWRRGLDVDDEDGEGEESRPTTSEGTVRGEEEVPHGKQAVTTT